MPGVTTIGGLRAQKRVVAQLELVQIPLRVQAAHTAVKKGVEGGVYAETEEAFERLGDDLEAYADWVKDNYSWKVWGWPDAGDTAQDLWDDPGFRYATMVMAPDDPEIPARGAPERMRFGFHQQWVELRRKAKKDPEFAWNTILKATEDGRPRTLNRIAVEGFGQNACSLPDSVRMAFFDMLSKNWLAFRILPPDKKKGLDLWLFWNDHHWRKGQQPENAE